MSKEEENKRETFKTVGRVGQNVKITSNAQGTIANFSLATGKGENTKWEDCVIFGNPTERFTGISTGASLEISGYRAPNQGKNGERIVVDSYSVYQKVQILGNVGHIEDKNISGKDLHKVIVYENGKNGKSFELESWEAKAAESRSAGLKVGDKVEFSGIAKVSEKREGNTTYHSLVVNNPKIHHVNGVELQQAAKAAPESEKKNSKPKRAGMAV